MTSIRRAARTDEKLSVLSQDSQYDLACSCGITGDHRRRSVDGKWIYPVALPDRKKVFLFKTLLSNECVNDCRYCPLRAANDVRRHTLDTDELVRAFREYYARSKVMGLFLTSGVLRDPDTTMEKMNRTARTLRKSGFKGYLHLKVIPGASDAAIEDAVSLASAVSVNIETAGERNFALLGSSKDYLRDIIHPIELISRLTGKGSPYSRVKQTTQFVVGASRESDKEIVHYSWGLYRRLGLSRVYFSSYQRGVGDSRLPGEDTHSTNDELLAREHRLYQVDWLIRKYGFEEDEIPFEKDGNLSLEADPKEIWAGIHPEFFPVDVNRAGRSSLLRVPGFGPVTVDRILKLRRNGGKVRTLASLGRMGKRLKRAGQYVKFGY
jgi:predicted DNA-binding helix-hairpin-helix protein